MMPSWIRTGGDGSLLLTLHVQPNARTSGPAGRHGDALRFRVRAPAVENRANAALIDYLHEALGIPKSNLRIRHGATGRRKIVELVDAPEGAMAVLRGWDAATTA